MFGTLGGIVALVVVVKILEELSLSSFQFCFVLPMVMEAARIACLLAGPVTRMNRVFFLWQRFGAFVGRQVEVTRKPNQSRSIPFKQIIL
jgi:hypothetical protein